MPYLVEYGYDRYELRHWKCETFNECINAFNYFKNTYPYVIASNVDTDEVYEVHDETLGEI
jgi:hypothetical protein